jgi:hypothetical protein
MPKRRYVSGLGSQDEVNLSEVVSTSIGRRGADPRMSRLFRYHTGPTLIHWWTSICLRKTKMCWKAEL